MACKFALNLLALSGLLVTLLVITVMPGSSIMDLDIDVGAKVLAIYVAYIAWTLLIPSLGNYDLLTISKSILL